MCLAVGESSRRISTHLVAVENSKRVKPVALPPGRAKLATNPCPTGSLTFTNIVGMLFVSLFTAANAAVPSVMSTSGRHGNQFRGVFTKHSLITIAPAIFKLDISSRIPSERMQT